MKKNRVYKLIISFILLSLIFSTNGLMAQYKARISADYNKVMGEGSSLEIEVKFKGEDGYEMATMLPLNIYEEVADDSLVFVGETKTSMKGKASFSIPKEHFVYADSVIKYVYVVKVENSEEFKDASKTVKFMDADLKTEVVEKDSVYHISALFTDVKGNPIGGEDLDIKVKRLFGSIRIGGKSYETNEDGIILVPIEEPLPGVDGVLTFEIMHDSRKYGIVKSIFEAPIGTPIIDQSTFDDSTMWSPPKKTPLFLWIFPNLVILGIWTVIFLLVGNLVKIYKSK